MPSADGTVRTRSRLVKRCFTLLRFCDSLEVPRSNIQRTLESSGRAKELEFSNNATTEVNSGRDTTLFPALYNQTKTFQVNTLMKIIISKLRLSKR